ncbi:MAG: hypothetical protein H0S80_08060 [Desulfovibrionaceae bacterium]|nr:hypothetical protein [Desulfovibrionaceae bacterium]
MKIMELVFLLSFFAMAAITFRLWRLSREQPAPGLGWWACGGCGIGLTALMVLIGPLAGRWVLTVAMLPVLLVALGMLEFLARNRDALHDENDE